MNRPTPRPFIHAWRDYQAISDAATIVQLERQIEKLCRAAEVVIKNYGNLIRTDIHRLQDAVDTAKAHLS